MYLIFSLMLDFFRLRLSELIALVSVSTTVFLFIHTQILTARIDEIQNVLISASSPSDQQCKFYSFNQSFINGFK